MLSTKQVPLFAISFFCSLSLFAQTVTVTQKCILPLVIDESSGIEVNSRNKIWSHNDSGGNPELYETDSMGVLQRTLQITNATNSDWEDLAQDSLGNYYIGDFGNNNNDRQDLKIYKIQNPDSFAGNTTTAQVIHFTYPDQTAFPPPDIEKNFDAEGFIAVNNALYIFTKNRTNPYDGYTKLYKLPDTAGTYVAQLLDSFYTGNGSWIFYSITSADISPDNSKLVLITNNMLFLFTGFTGEQFFSGTVQQFTIIGALTQKESVCFISNTELYLTDEKTGTVGGNLYYLNLQPFLSGVETTTNSSALNATISPNPLTGNCIISLTGNVTGKLNAEIISVTGQIVNETSFYKSNAEIKIPLATDNIAKGIYTLKIVTENGISVKQKLIKL